MYKKRWISERLVNAINVSRVLVLTGARQTGKTTLLKNEQIFNDYKYFTLDDLDTFGEASKSPLGLLKSGKNIIIDEAQRVPDLLPAIKQIVDEEGDTRFVISGSANLLLLNKVTETLAGRATYNTLYPFTLSEWKEGDKSYWLLKLFEGIYPEEQELTADNSILPVLFRGFLPPLFYLKNENQVSIWWEGYVKTYLERDLRDISHISSLVDFRNIMELLALRTGSLVDQTSISNDTGISQPTVHRYINLLETSHLFIRLRPFTLTESKRITKTPKGYFIDTGLASYLAGIKESKSIVEKFAGHLFESMILLNFLVLSEIFGMRLFFWRTKGDRETEVDFVVQYKNKFIGIETKLSKNIGFSDFKSLETFKSYCPNFAAGIVIYSGDKVLQFGENMFAIPWQMF